MEGTITFKDVKNSDGWIFLSEKCPKFEELANKFIKEAENFVEYDSFNPGAISSNQDGKTINYESYYYGSKEVVFSYTTNPMEREDYCQFKAFKKIKFSLNEDGNLIINELSGRVESNYGHTFDDTDGGVLKTAYSYQEFSPEGIELIYRGYDDKFIFNAPQFSNYSYNLRGIISGGFNPRLEEFEGTKVKLSEYNPAREEDLKEYEINGFYGKEPTLIELLRDRKNLGVVREINTSYDKYGNNAGRIEKYHYNTVIGAKDNVDPFMIHINRGIPPIVIKSNDELVINYQDCGVRLNNYKEAARTRYCMEINNRRNELMDELADIPTTDEKRYNSVKTLLDKYTFLYKENDLDKWIWKEIDSKSPTKK